MYRKPTDSSPSVFDKAAMSLRADEGFLVTQQDTGLSKPHMAIDTCTKGGNDLQTGL